MEKLIFDSSFNFSSPLGCPSGTCVPDACPNPTNSSGGHLVSPKNISVGTQNIFKCKPGYTVYKTEGKDSTTVTCMPGIGYEETPVSKVNVSHLSKGTFGRQQKCTLDPTPFFQYSFS